MFQERNTPRLSLPLTRSSGHFIDDPVLILCLKDIESDYKLRQKSRNDKIFCNYNYKIL